MTWNLLLIVGCILLSAFFSGSETALSGAQELRLEHLSEQRQGGYGLALSIKRGYEKALISILVGNNLVNTFASALATVVAMELMGEKGAWAATAVMTLVIITLGEIIPKILASTRPEGVSALVAPLLRLWMLLTWPLTGLFARLLKGISRLWNGGKQGAGGLTEEDLETIIETVEDEGVVDQDTADLLQSALDFGDVLAYEIITPRVDLVALDIDDPRQKQLQVAFASPYTRLPVYQESLDNIVGILHLNHLYKALVKDPDTPVEGLLLQPLFVHKTMPLNDVFNAMRRRKAHMAVVTDEYGGTMGVLTMEDVLEQLVGDIWDESDEIEEELVEIGPHTFEVDGDMRLGDFLEAFDQDEEDVDDDNATVGGWAVEMLGGYPRLHDSFTYRDLTITIEKKNNLRVLGLLVQQDPDWVDTDEEEDSLIDDE